MFAKIISIVYFFDLILSNVLFYAVYFLFLIVSYL